MEDELDFGQTIPGLTPGQRVFERYVLKNILGQGGMGVVWLATDQTLDRPVALKMLPQVVARDAVAVDELKQETRKCLSLSHSHIIHTYDFVEDNASAAIAMEFVDGATLSELRIRREDRIFEVDDISVWIRQVCAALEYAHQKRKIVHRDLKPANIMVDSDGDAKVADFGISSSISDSVSRVTRDRSTSGTLAYMSPQQSIGNRPQITDDLYSLGATIYELLTGKPPFYSGSLYPQVRDVIPPRMSQRRAEFGIENSKAIPEAWEQAIASCLAKHPEDRPDHCRDFLNRLDHKYAPQISTQPLPATPATAESTGAVAPVKDSSPVKPPPLPLATFWNRSSKQISNWLKETSTQVQSICDQALIRVRDIDFPGAFSKTTSSARTQLEIFSRKLLKQWIFFKGKCLKNPALARAKEKLSQAPQLLILRGAVLTGLMLLGGLLFLLWMVSHTGYDRASQGTKFQNSTGMEMLWLSPGTDLLGSPETEPGRDSDERPYTARITRGFWMGQYEVTQEEWQSIMEDNPSAFRGARNPVEQVSWFQAMQFCRLLTARDRKNGIIGEDFEYRLPTEAEWEYACRAGTDTTFSTGNKLAARSAQFNWEHPYQVSATAPAPEGTVPTGCFDPNPWGFHDMHGNVWEWAYNTRILEPTHVARGGGWTTHGEGARSANRYPVEGTKTSSAIGFRVVCVPSDGPTTEIEAIPEKITTPPPPDRLWSNSLGMEFREIDPGSFQMGSPPSEPGRSQNEGLIMTTISQPYMIGTTEISQNVWQQVMGTSIDDQIAEALEDETLYALGGEPQTLRQSWGVPDGFANSESNKKSLIRALGGLQGPRYPMAFINWEEASRFCEKLTEIERSAGRLPEGYEYRLPTEAEWEYACRAGTRTALYNGPILIKGKYNAPALDEIAWYGGNSSHRYNGSVGWNTKNWSEMQYPGGLAGWRSMRKKAPNGWGIYDMLGNVSEWCLDRYQDTLPGGSDPVGSGDETLRSFRGGSWLAPARDCRSAYRNGIHPNFRSGRMGFRVVCAPVRVQTGAAQLLAGDTLLQKEGDRLIWRNTLGMRFTSVTGLKVLVAQHETRVEDYRKFIRSTGHDSGDSIFSLSKEGWARHRGHSWEYPGFDQGSDHPVVGVSWDDANAFCQWLTEHERSLGKLSLGQHYRLPSDWEWGRAAGLRERNIGRPDQKDARLEDRFPWGNSWPPPQGFANYADVDALSTSWSEEYSIIENYRDGFPRTSPVMQYHANRNGLYDMSGNVWEWCYDWYSDRRKKKFFRGGSWLSAKPIRMNLSERMSDFPSTRSATVGFRCVLVLEGEPEKVESNNLTIPTAPTL